VKDSQMDFVLSRSRKVNRQQYLTDRGNTKLNSSISLTAYTVAKGFNHKTMTLNGELSLYMYLLSERKKTFLAWNYSLQMQDWRGIDSSEQYTTWIIENVK
jgi:hypothetical protein